MESVSEAASSATVDICGEEVGGVDGGCEELEEEDSASSHDNDNSSALLAIVEGPREEILDSKVESSAELPGSEYGKLELLDDMGMFESVAVLQLGGVGL